MIHTKFLEKQEEDKPKISRRKESKQWTWNWWNGNKQKNETD
jgi:hypothetical protein